MGTERTYICIDLKTFYASVECVERGLDPLATNLVVADPDRSKTTICLAVTPALKRQGIRNRCRLFEIPADLPCIVAKPRMRLYMEVSARIYGIYLRYVSPEDIHPYSIDECFIDATPYLSLYGTTPRAFADQLRRSVLEETGILATAGIGPNLFLAKVALDIEAKKVEDGIGELDPDSFRREIWPHRPITDIWQIGPGIARRLEKYHVHDLGGVARLNPRILYREFGVNAEYLIDHANGIEPTTIADIRAYVPEASSTVNGQILPSDYRAEDARLVLKEMVDASALDLVEQGLACGRISLAVGYARGGRGPRDGRLVVGEHGTRRHGGAPGPGSGTSRKLPEHTDSRRQLIDAFLRAWDEEVDPGERVRRISIGFEDLVPKELASANLFTDLEAERRERDLAQAVIAVKGKFGKNALVKGISLTEKATGRERNELVGGHHG